MSDQVVVGEDAEDRANQVFDQTIEEYDDTIAEIEEQDEQPSVADIQAQIAEQEARLSTRDTGLSDGLKDLAEAVKTIKQEPTSTPQTQSDQPSYQDILKSAKDNYFDAPVDNVDRLIDAKVKELVGPALQNVAQRLLKTEASYTKQQVMADDTGKFVLETYGDEVEQAVKGGKDYQEAVQEVTSKHINEVIDHRIEQRLAQVGEGQDEVKVANQAAPKGTGKRPSPNSGVPRVPLSMKAQLQAEAKQKSVPYEAYVNYLHRKHPEKLKKGGN